MYREGRSRNGQKKGSGKIEDLEIKKRRKEKDEGKIGKKTLNIGKDLQGGGGRWEKERRRREGEGGKKGKMREGNWV